MDMAADKKNKLRGALWGLYIGDALAMPVHWYYNRSALHDDYGWVTDYVAFPAHAGMNRPPARQIDYR